MIDEELLRGDKQISLVIDGKRWEECSRLAKKLGRPYSASVLMRLFLKEGLERHKKKGG